MQKRKLDTTLILVVSLFIIFVFSVDKVPEKKIEMLMPTESRSDVDGEDHEGREEYLKFRFGGNSEENWQESYDSLRRNVSERRMMKRRTQTSETIANGLLTGQWVERGAKNQSGRVTVTDVLESQDLVVLGTEGGSVMIGPISGNEYEILNDQIRFNLVGVHSFELPDGTVRIVALDSKAIYYTDNNGETWEKSYSGNIHTSTLSREDNTLYAITYYGDIISSTDMGETFSSLGVVSVSSGSYELWTPRYTSGEVYLLAGSTLYKKNGNSFSKVGAVSGGSSTSRIALSGDNTKADSPLFAAYHGASTTVKKSTNGGVSWTSVTSPSTGMFSANSFYSSTDQVLYAGEMECFRSTNGGNSWSKINTWTQYYEVYGGDPEVYLHADIPEIRSYQDKTGKDFTLVSTDGGTYITYNHRSYRNITMTGMRNNQYYGQTTRWEEPDYIVAGAQDQGAQISVPANGTGIMDFNQYASGDQGSYTSSDSGKSAWFTYIYGSLYYHPNTKVATAHGAGAPSSSDKFLWISPTVADPSNPKIVYTGGSSVYKTVYNGSNNISHSKHSSGSLGATITALAISPIDNKHWYAATKNKEFYHSSDRGVNWTRMATSIPANNWLVGQGIIADPNVLGRVYLSGNGNGQAAVFVSDAHGKGFTPLGTDYPVTSVLDLDFNEDGSLLFAAAYDAAYVYIVSERKWYNLTGNSGPDTPYFTVEYIPTIETVRYATHGRGIWDFNLGEVVEPDPFVEVTAPEGNSVVMTGDTVTISWSGNIDGDVSVSLLRDGVFDQTIKTLPFSEKQVEWFVDNSIDIEGTFTIEINSEIYALVDTSDGSFTIRDLKLLPQSHISVESFSSEYSEAYAATLALDDDEQTFWHNTTDGTDDLPSELVFKLDSSYVLTAFSYLPRQDKSADSRVKEFNLYTSNDGTNWSKIHSGEWQDISTKRFGIFADESGPVSYVKIEMNSSTNGKAKASVAEFNLYYNDKKAVALTVGSIKQSRLALHSIREGEINLTVPSAGNYRIKINSLDGRVLLDMQQDFTTGNQLVNFPHAGLANQIAILSVQGMNKSLMQKITIR